MKPIERAIYFIVLPTIAILLYPPQALMAAFVLVLVMAGLFILLGLWVWRGSTLALNFGIFVQGMNVITRLMMFFGNARNSSGVTDYFYIITSLIGLLLSLYLVLRYDSQDIRTRIVQ